MVPPETQLQPSAKNSSRTLIFYLLCISFILNGVIITFIGPLLTVFRVKWGLDDGRAGLFSTMQFSFSLAGVLISSALVSAKGFKPAITIGLAMLGIGFALLNAPTFPLALAASAIYGLGYGLSIPGTNLWVGESYADRRASALNIMNLAWGVGAIVSAPIAKVTIQSSTVTIFLYVVGSLTVGLALLLLRMHFGQPPHAESSLPAGQTAPAAGTAAAVLLGVLFFVYVGTEIGVSYWSTLHAQRATNWTSNNFTFTQMFFYAGLLGGRGAGAAILLRLKEMTVVVSGILLAAAGILLFLSAHSPVSLFSGAFFSGLGLASLYPIYIAWLSKWFGTRARKVGGVLFALASLGASTMPAIVGFVSRYAGSLRVGLLVPLAGCAVMLTAVFVLRPNTRG